MIIDRVIVGDLFTNCYILSIDNECLVIDPGSEFDKIKKVIGNKEVVGTIVTHHHFDHVGALKYFKNIYDYHNLKEGINNIGKFVFEVIYTPGHTNDSITLYFKNINSMFVGDFIFKDGIGRTDLGGNYNELLNSLSKISKYSKDIIVYPGHGNKTILGVEIKKISNYNL